MVLPLTNNSSRRKISMEMATDFWSFRKDNCIRLRVSVAEPLSVSAFSTAVPVSPSSRRTSSTVHTNLLCTERSPGSSPCRRSAQRTRTSNLFAVLRRLFADILNIKRNFVIMIRYQVTIQLFHVIRMIQMIRRIIMISYILK